MAETTWTVSWRNWHDLALVLAGVAYAVSAGGLAVTTGGGLCWHWDVPVIVLTKSVNYQSRDYLAGDPYCAARIPGG